MRLQEETEGCEMLGLQSTLPSQVRPPRLLRAFARFQRHNKGYHQIIPPPRELQKGLSGSQTRPPRVHGRMR
jgi:hypothetical protein